MCRLCHDPYQPPCFLSLFRVLHEVAACSSSPSRLLFSPTGGPLLAWLQDVAPFFFTPSGSRALGSFFPTRIARLRSYLLPAPTAQPQRPAVLPSQKSTSHSTFSHEYKHTSCFTLRVSSLGGSRIIAARLMCTTRTDGVGDEETVTALKSHIAVCQYPLANDTSECMVNKDISFDIHTYDARRTLVSRNSFSMVTFRLSNVLARSTVGCCDFPCRYNSCIQTTLRGHCGLWRSGARKWMEKNALGLMVPCNTVPSCYSRSSFDSMVIQHISTSTGYELVAAALTYRRLDHLI